MEVHVRTGHFIELGDVDRIGVRRAGRHVFDRRASGAAERDRLLSRVVVFHDLLVKHSELRHIDRVGILDAGGHPGYLARIAAVADGNDAVPTLRRGLYAAAVGVARHIDAGSRCGPVRCRARAQRYAAVDLSVGVMPNYDGVRRGRFRCAVRGAHDDVVAAPVHRAPVAYDDVGLAVLSDVFRADDGRTADIFTGVLVAVEQVIFAQLACCAGQSIVHARQLRSSGVVGRVAAAYGQRRAAAV